MITAKLKELGFEFQPAPVPVPGFKFHPAVQTGNLVFTSGQVSVLGDEAIKGKVGEDVDLETAQRAAEICAFNCIRAVGAVADIDKIHRIVKVLGMVNVGKNFNNTSGVINGATEFFNKLVGEDNGHARSAVGMVLPGNWAVEIEIVVELKD